LGHARRIASPKQWLPLASEPAPGIGDLGSRLGRQVAGSAKLKKKKKIMNNNFMIIHNCNLFKPFFFADNILMKAFERHYTDVKELG